MPRSLSPASSAALASRIQGAPTVPRGVETTGEKRLESYQPVASTCLHDITQSLLHKEGK